MYLPNGKQVKLKKRNIRERLYYKYKSFKLSLLFNHARMAYWICMNGTKKISILEKLKEEFDINTSEFADKS